MGKKLNNTYLTVAQIVVWAVVLLLPAGVNLFVSNNPEHALSVLQNSFMMTWPGLVLYLVNYLVLVPFCLFKDGRKKWFWIVNLILLVVLNRHFLNPRPIPQEAIDNMPFKVSEMWAFYVVGALSSALFQAIFILLAVGIRYIIRSHKMELQLQEEKRKTAEAELTWLKNQLNPHFLFNTLNNISSLTQIDPDKAQESIGQLSDLLRYALYDSESEKVQLASEIEFMDNYIDLMALRCNELTTVEKHLEAPSRPVEVAPLLFISLIENAFKHGVNARHESFVRVSMNMEGDDLVFVCDNSLFEKQGTDQIGSGIGLENMKRRLELLYPGRYTYEQDTADGTYHVKVTLKAL